MQFHCDRTAADLDSLSRRAEEAVADLLSIFEEESGIVLKAIPPSEKKPCMKKKSEKKSNVMTVVMGECNLTG